MSKLLDVVIFGATGYTGKFVTRQLAKVFKTEGIKFGVADHSSANLTETLRTISSEESILTFKSNIE
jgi:short subunit dehydrogenase-like uncharacterized protein